MGISKLNEKRKQKPTTQNVFCKDTVITGGACGASSTGGFCQ